MKNKKKKRERILYINCKMSRRFTARMEREKEKSLFFLYFFLYFWVEIFIFRTAWQNNNNKTIQLESKVISPRPTSDYYCLTTAQGSFRTRIRRVLFLFWSPYFQRNMTQKKAISNWFFFFFRRNLPCFSFLICRNDDASIKKVSSYNIPREAHSIRLIYYSYINEINDV